MAPTLCHLHKESGTALLASALLVFLLTGAGMAAVMPTSVNQNASKNVLTSKQAFYLADGGIQHAKTFLTQNQSNWNTYASASAQTLLPSTSLASTGGYSVTIQDGGGGSLLIRSTGAAAGNAQTVIQSLVTRTAAAYTPRYAFITGKNIAMNVNASIQGTSGGVHANGDLYIENTPKISTDATASGQYRTALGPATIGGASGGGTPLEAIPAIRPDDFSPYRDYRLASDGKVYDKNGVYVGSGGGGKGWYGWIYTNQNKWLIAAGKFWTVCNNYLNGTFYVEGDAMILGDFGNNGWDATIIATGSIDVASRNINIKPPTPNGNFCNGLTTYHPETKDILFLAGGDIYIHPPQNGTAQTFTGLLAAHEQIGVQGFSTTTINGALVAEDAATTSSVVPGDDYLGYCSCTATTGAPTINYSGELGNPTLQGGTVAVQLMTWQVMQ